MNSLSRTEKLIGEQALDKLKNSNLLIVGLGGVGGYCLEMLVRSGVSSFTLVDGDCFDVTNLNRQLIATIQNIGKFKVDEAAARCKAISPNSKVRSLKMRYNQKTSYQILDTEYDYVLDCIDSVADKVHLILQAKSKNIPIISAMGAGNRISPQFEVADIFSTKNDGLAKAVRSRVKGYISSLKVVYDGKGVIKTDGVPSSISYAPALMGCIMASEVIKDIICR